MLNISGFSFEKTNENRTPRKLTGEDFSKMLLFFIEDDNILYKNLLNNYGSAEKALDALRDYQCDCCGKIDMDNKIENICEGCREDHGFN